MPAWCRDVDAEVKVAFLGHSGSCKGQAVRVLDRVCRIYLSSVISKHTTSLPPSSTSIVNPFSPYVFSRYLPISKAPY